MTPYYQDDAVTIYHGDSREMIGDLTFESVVTDPPYGTGFRGVEGDSEYPFDLLPFAGPTIAFGSPKLLVSDIGKFRRPPTRVMVWAPAFSWSKQSDRGVLYKWTPIYCWNQMSTSRDEEPYGDVFTDFDAATSSITKPVVLMRRLIGMTAGVVLDPFMGSGSTLRAAKDLGRHAIGIEIDEAYCERAATRLSQEVLGLAV